MITIFILYFILSITYNIYIYICNTSNALTLNFLIVFPMSFILLSNTDFVSIIKLCEILHNNILHNIDLLSIFIKDLTDALRHGILYTGAVLTPIYGGLTMVCRPSLVWHIRRGMQYAKYIAIN